MRKARLIQVAVFAAGFFVFGEVGLLLRAGDIAPIWPASGVAAAAFAVVPKRRWPGLIATLSVVNVVSNTLHGSSLLVAVLFAVANMAEGMVAGSIIGAAIPQRRRLVRSRDVGIVGIGAVAGALTGALLGAVFLSLTVGASMATVFPGWFISDVVGILVFGPSTLAVVALIRDRSPQPWVGKSLLLLAAMTAIYPLSQILNLGVYFLVLIPLASSAYLLGPRMTAILLAYNAVATTAMVVITTPTEMIAESLVTTQIFIGVLQITVLALAAEAGRANDLIVELQSVFDAAVEAVLVVDETDTIRSANNGAAETFGRQIDAIVGSVVSEHLYVDSGEILPPPGEVARVTGVRSDGSTFPAEVTVGAISEPSGRTRRAVIARDVTVRYEAERARDRFVSAMTHELRNPLTGMLGMAELTLYDVDEIDRAELRSRLEMIHSDGESLAEIIDDLLSMKKLESSTAADHEPLDLAALVRDAAHRLSAAARVRDIHLGVDVIDTAVVGDAGQLTRAIQNLISNAIKYSHDGSDIEVSLTHESDMAVVAVEDNGIGIPADEVDSVLDRFYRASNSGETKASGTGLGLALVGETVRRHGGELVLNSVEGKGTVVSLTIPLATDVAPVPEALAI